MPLPKQIKVLYGCNDDEGKPIHSYHIVKRLYAAIAEEYGDQVRQAVVTDEMETFIAVTDCGWWRLDLMAWSIGHPGVGKYVIRMRELDEDGFDAESYYRAFLDA